MALTRKERLGLMSARRAALDVKAAQVDLDGKAPAVHGHAISDVSGLQVALDGKQPTGSYVLTVNFTWDNLAGKPSTFPPSAHGHVIADVTGLQTALDAKLATTGFTWNNLSGKPTTFAPSAHSHVIADVTGLQTALDGKQPTGSYLTSINSTQVINALGYTPVQQSGASGMTGSKIYIGWLGSQVGIQVDTTNFGGTWPINTKGVHYGTDTAFYVDPSGGSRVNTLGVVTETTYPGSINGDYASGYYHFSDAQNTPTSSYGHAHIIRLSSDWNVQMFFPTSNNNEPFWIRKKQGGTYTSWRRMLQEDEWIGSKYLGSDGSIYSKIVYEADNTGYYFDGNGTTRVNALNSNSLYSFGNVTAEGDMVVGNGKASSYIYMADTDEGQRTIHCNSNRIGFLRQDGGWGAWCEDDGSWGTDTACNAPIFYDRNNTGYYVNPDGTTSLNSLNCAGLIVGRTSSGTDVNVMNDTGSLSVRGDVNNGATMSFHRAGAWAINMGIGTDNIFKIGGWSAQSNCFQMDGNGNLTMLGNITAYSDARLKKDVETISGALDMVSAMRGVRYTRIDSGERQVGVIAQEMQEVVPEVVQTGMGDDDTLSVAYGNLVGVLIEAVKELRAEVAALKAQGT